MKPETASDLRCGLLRRLMAVLYDGIVLIAILFCAAIPPTVLMVSLGNTMQEESTAFRLAMAIYLLLVTFAFYGGFWMRGGQTIGMRAWHIRVVRRDGGAVRWRDAAARFSAAIVSWLALGLGFLWALVDREGLTWHDRWSATELRRSYRADG